ncbi:hypothetical protein LTR62_007052 [Meristemomyces frigidus]|uniref:Heterokaryon incompatibility domain-containing protein n=1 Tax=Meristemomyces frigidus TaxID=1508187 RepID=A0AAN7YE13_9PEZI|nr:hypothetical protein LTR62_007052 [Meristemomyces frigidus]
MLCESCQSIKLAKGKANEQTYLHLPNRRALVESATAGCNGCRFFESMLDRYRLFHEQSQCPSAPSDANPIVLTSSTDEQGCFDEVHSEARDSRVTGREISRDVGTGDGLAWIRSQLAECASSEDHAMLCSRGETALPLRVIDVSATAEDSGVRLIINQGGHLTGRYAALSWRWELQRPLVTTKATLKEYQEHIPYQNLPRAFKDGCSDSALSRRQSLRSTQLSGANAPIWLRGTEDENLERFEGGPAPDKNYRRSVWQTIGQSSTLGTRAWCYQEQLLAQRAVIFSPCQLMFQCRSIVRIESSTWTDPLTLSGIEPAEHHDREALWAQWKYILRRYSSLDLTFGADKLIALAGIAKRAGQLLRDEYIAGIWKSAIVELLAWRVEDNFKNPPEHYRAPSWSWAAHDSPLAPIQENKREPHGRDMALLDHNVGTTTGDPFAPVTHAWLKVRGYCVEITNRPGFYDGLWTFHRSDPADPRRWKDVAVFADKWDLVPLHTYVSDDTLDKAVLTSAEDGGNGAAAKFLVMQLCRRVMTGWGAPRPMEIWCLVLQGVEGKESTYRRVGMASVDRRVDLREAWTEDLLVLV